MKSHPEFTILKSVGGYEFVRKEDGQSKSLTFQKDELNKMIQTLLQAEDIMKGINEK